MNDSLKKYRELIDSIDDDILELLGRRAEHAKAIGNLKNNGPAYRAEREAQILRCLSEKNPGPLSKESVLSVFSEIISACRALEDALSVAFLGPEGTYSEEAAVKHFGSSITAIRCTNIDDVFSSVELTKAGYGVVPVENSSEGAVGRTLDLLMNTKLKVCGEIMLPVHQCLLSKGSKAEIERVFSHSQSLAQCQRWLKENYPQAELTAMTSNTQAAALASKDQHAAAVASRAAASIYSMNILAENIEDNPNNTTRFLVISTDDAQLSGKDKTSIVVSSKNQPGAIHGLLTPLAQHHVSMSKLESRPSHTGLWEYVFFIDLDGHREDKRIAQALQEMGKSAAFLKILGSYPVAVY